MKLIIAALLVFCGTAQAEMSGDDLNAFCKTFNETEDMDAGAAICFGYALGVADNLNVCGEPTHFQMTRVVREYLSDHPERHHHNAISLVIDALQESYPCKNLLKGA